MIVFLTKNIPAISAGHREAGCYQILILTVRWRSSVKMSYTPQNSYPLLLWSEQGFGEKPKTNRRRRDPGRSEACLTADFFIMLHKKPLGGQHLSPVTWKISNLLGFSYLIDTHLRLTRSLHCKFLVGGIFWSNVLVYSLFSARWLTVVSLSLFKGLHHCPRDCVIVLWCFEWLGRDRITHHGSE